MRAGQAMMPGKTTWARVDGLRRRIQPCVLYNAPGGGLGYLNRTLALARQLSRTVGGEHRVLTNSPFAGSFGESVDGIRIESLASNIKPADAGYNLVAETDALGLPRVLLPQPRKYDNQFQRAGNSQQCPGSLDDLVGLIVQQGTKLMPAQQRDKNSAEMIRFANGAVAATELISNAMSQG